MPTTGPIVRGSGPRGGFLDYFTAKLKRDRHGVLSGTTLRHYKVGPVNQRIDTAWLDPVGAPNPGWGIPCVEADADVRDGMCIVTYTYEGLNPDQAAPGDDAITYELDASMGDKRIETHPSFEKLKTQFGWDDELKCFAEFLPGNSGGQTGLSKASQKGKRSPLAGLDSWFFVGVTYRINYAARTIPQSLIASIGTLINRPPNIGQFKLPPASKKRKWLIMAPKLSRRGNCVQIGEEYLLGEPGGLPEAIYSAGQLGEAGSGGGSGLSTGGLSTGSL